MVDVPHTNKNKATALVIARACVLCMSEFEAPQKNRHQASYIFSKLTRACCAEYVCTVLFCMHVARHILRHIPRSMLRDMFRAACCATCSAQHAHIPRNMHSLTSKRYIQILRVLQQHAHECKVVEQNKTRARATVVCAGTPRTAVPPTSKSDWIHDSVTKRAVRFSCGACS